MFEFDRQIPLPFVEASADDAIDKLASFIGRIVSFKIPAFGIVDEPKDDWQTLMAENHMQHRGMILAALKLNMPQVLTDKDFDSPQVTDVINAMMHADALGERFKKSYDLDGTERLKMVLRLHTNLSPLNVDVCTVNGVAGIKLNGPEYEPETYTFNEAPGCSVFFRSLTTLGSTTYHEFTSPDDQRRDIGFSNLNVYSQSL